MFLGGHPGEVCEIGHEHLRFAHATCGRPRASTWQTGAGAVTMGAMSDPLGTPGTPKSLPLILARELASNLATPMFLMDAGGMLVFYNDAAALLLGKPFDELGEIPSGEFGAALELTTPDGRADPAPRLAVGRRVLRAAARAPDGRWRRRTTACAAPTKPPRTRCSARPARCTAWSRCSGPSRPRATGERD